MDRRILVVDGYIPQPGCCKSGTLDIEAVDDEESEEDDPVPEVQVVRHCSKAVESLETERPSMVLSHPFKQVRLEPWKGKERRSCLVCKANAQV